MYNYYMKVLSAEHMLYRKEIAEFYGFYTTKNVPHSRLITSILKEHASMLNTEYPEYYWNDFHFQVWPYTQYGPAMQWFTEVVSRTHETQHTFSDGKTYDFVMKNPVINV